jgi:phosphatidylserine/phosphatidylglycerophosphate/cardiolipin synthase-like enzyme
LQTGRLAPPYLPAGLHALVNSSVAGDVARSLQGMNDGGMQPPVIARCVELLAEGFERRPPLEDLIDLVTTGPEGSSVANRDTSVVVQGLFRKAQHSVLLAGYAVYQGQKLFQTLADSMKERSDLKVRLFLDIQRKPGDTSAASELAKRFANRFRTSQWPRQRPLPDVYYDPRSLALEPEKCAALHAKCVVVDDRDVFVSSANFTEAAQERNIEVGLLLHSPVVAERIERFFESLVANGHFQQVIGT